jgi:iron-sulfur cluster assembly accessory protein
MVNDHGVSRELDITDRAKLQLLKVANGHSARYVRYSLNGGGCSGFIGRWDIEHEKESNDYSCELGNDKLFLIDSITLKMLTGATIDYTGDFMPAFKVHIPNTASCGCGESFVMT